MRETIWTTLFDNGYVPHGYCLLWEPSLFWSHAASDAVIAFAYFSIPAVLVTFGIRRTDFEYRWVLHLFGAFIIGCGLTHVMAIWTLWVPSYGAEAAVKVVTALISICTAILLWPLLPKILALPSMRELEQRNLALAIAISSHQAAEAELAALNRDLETRVAMRTADLEAKNEELARATGEAREANDAKSRFLSMMSHEIRTPLNAVINMVELLMETQRAPADRSYLRTIATSSRALLEIAEDILDVSRIEAGYLQIVPVDTDVEAIVDEVVQSVAPLAHRKGIDIAATIGARTPATATLDAARLRQVLLNLAGNAVNYTQAGWVHIDVDFQQRASGDVLIFEVADTGVGIDEADRERIFERFSRLDRTDGSNGTGLGLSISRHLAEAMGGAIELSSRVGVGSAFRLILPVRSYVPSGSTPIDFSVSLIGPPSRTRQSLATTLAGCGARLHLDDGDDATARDAPERTDVALVVLPVTGVPRGRVADLCRLARAAGDRLMLFVPVGRFGGEASAAPEDIRVETYPIGRTTLLRCLTDQRQELASAPAPAAGSVLSGARVLVVDDNPDNRFVAERGLSYAGAVVKTVPDGQTAVAAVARGSFDAVLLDLRMPGLDGFATAAQIRALPGPPALVPIIAVSANITPETIRQIEIAGMDGYLAKPFRPKDLRRKLEECLSGTGPAGQGQAADAGGPAPVLDPGYLAEAIELTTPEIVSKTIDRFLDGIDERLQAIGTSDTADRQADGLHALAGSAGALGLIELTRACRSGEDGIRGGGPASAEMLAGLRTMVDRAVVALRHFRQDPAAHGAGPADRAAGGAQSD